jgi:hypothetical protein
MAAVAPAILTFTGCVLSLARTIAACHMMSGSRTIWSSGMPRMSNTTLAGTGTA